LLEKDEDDEGGFYNNKGNQYYLDYGIEKL
jgi:hypothetical protein